MPERAQGQKVAEFFRKITRFDRISVFCGLSERSAGPDRRRDMTSRQLSGARQAWFQT